MTKYIARLDNEIVGKRTSKDRVYTHAIVVHNCNGPHVATWCGRLDLALGEKRKRERSGFPATIVPVEIAPSNARTAKALNDSGVFAPFTVIGTD